MVYCGRPSTGCGNCKKRRIKCDENRPQCRHCVKTSRECPGYSAEIDLLLRKEEPGRRKKVKKAPSESDITSSPGKRAYDEGGYTLVPDSARRTRRQRRSSEIATQRYRSLQWVHVGAPRANSVPDLVQQAESESLVEEENNACFINGSALSPQTTYSPSDSPGLAASVFDSAQDGSLLSLATEAVASALMARSTGFQHPTEHAARSYGKALAVTQKAMQNPAHATNDETLLAILLLALYESIANTHQSMAAWNKHVEGAIAIVRARDMQQLAKLDSVSLFRTVRTRMLTSALEHRQALTGHLPIVDQPYSAKWEGAIDQSSNANVDPVLLEDGVMDPLCIGQQRLDGNRKTSRMESSRDDHSSIDEIDQ